MIGVTKELFTDDSLHKDEIIFRTRRSYFWIFCMAMSALISTGLHFSDNLSFAHTSRPYFTTIVAFSLFMASRKTKLYWNKPDKVAALETSVMGITRRRKIPFDRFIFEIRFINLFEPHRSNRGIDRNWFTLKLGRRIYLIPLRMKVIKENLCVAKQTLGLPKD